MIQCIIDGKVGYPDTNNKIKVTYENQYIKDSGSYTYQINFPMSILANKALFKNVDRFDVRKDLPDYEDCRLLVDNRLIISGKGTIMGITNESVKLQIIGGKSRIKYNSKMTSHYLDEIDYPDTGINTSSINFGIWFFQIKLEGVMEIDLSNTEVVGVKGKYAFNPIYDESNDIIANNVLVLQGKKGLQTIQKAYMYDVAIQPYLFYILKYVLELEGFTLRRNDFDKDPWNRLVICSARKGTDIKLALPHWSVYTFIEEIRKLFNASFIFDEVNKTVDIISTNELTANSSVSYECLDEFSVEHDEDGLKNLATSNVEYAFADSSNRDYRDVIPVQVQKKFPIKEYPYLGALLDDAENMTQKERMTTIFKIPEEYVLFVMEENDKGQEVETLTHGGFFNPLVRDEDSDEYEELKISPVAMVRTERWREEDNKWLKSVDVQDKNLKIVIPSMMNDKEADLDSMTFDDEEGEYYISVQDAMQDTDMIADNGEDDDEKMQVMFQSDTCYNYKQGMIEYPSRDGEGDYPAHRYPTGFTDYRMFRWFHSFRETASLSLNALPHRDTIGEYASDIKIDRHNLICIKFITDDIPDPTSIFVFHNKKYICQKVEMEVNEYGIDKVKTGYFYEFY